MSRVQVLEALYRPSTVFHQLQTRPEWLPAFRAVVHQWCYDCVVEVRLTREPTFAEQLDWIVDKTV